MRITSVRTYPLMSKIDTLDDAPVSIPRAAATKALVFAAYRSLLVRIDTDDGCHGVGEGLVRLAPAATAGIVDALAPILIGRDPRDVDVIWEDLYATMVNRGHTRGFMIEAISAIDIALWDLIGKHRAAPIHQLLGGAHVEQLPCYASSVRIKSPEAAASDARNLVNDGFTAIKLKIGRGSSRISEDVDSIHAVRDAIGPNVQLMVDANGGFELSGAKQLLPELVAARVAWFEEPVVCNDLGAYRTLRRFGSIPIAAGETWFTRYDFRDALAHEAVDIVQPDVSRAGGISEVMKIARMASAFNVAFAPHTGQSSAICLASTLHLAAAASNTLTYEFIADDWSASQPNPLRTSITTFDFEGSRSGSTIRIPHEPGIGLEVNWNAVDNLVVGA